MLVSVTGAAEIDPAPVKVQSQQHFNSFGCKSHGAFAQAGGWTREGRVAAPAALPGEVGDNVNQPLLAQGCAHGGLQCSWPYPHPLPKSSRHVATWLGWIKVQPVAFQ